MILRLRSFDYCLPDAYLWVEWVPSWKVGDQTEGWDSRAFGIQTMSSQLAQVYFPSLIYLDHR